VRPGFRLLFASIVFCVAAVAGCGGTNTSKSSSLEVTGSSTLCKVAPGPAPGSSSTVSVDRNVAYGASGVQPLLLDVYRPSVSGTPRPAVMVVHGGGWAGGDKADDALWSAGLAKAGFVTFDVNYALATPGRPGWPVQLQELRAAVRWIRAHAARYSVDPARVGALGASAGGNLVEMLGVDADGSCQQGDRVAAAVAWSGPTDLRALQNGATQCLKGRLACGSVGLASLLPDLVRRYLGCTVSSCPAKWSDASPISHVSSGASPTLLFNSTQEVVPLGQVQAFSKALAGAGVPHQLVVYPGSAHAEAYGQKAFPLSVTFLSRYLGGG
jgi:acetyl esterase/lipase